MLKKSEQKWFDLLKGRKHLGEDERILLARSLAASPDVRWQRHENFLRSHGLYKASSRKKSGFN